MFATDINAKVYNLSAGKSLPEWLQDKKKAKLRKTVNFNQNIELIQEFEMPGVSTSINLSPDNQYIIVTGTYKPRIRCFDCNNLSMKFERCFDSEVECFEILSDDYSKIVFLQNDRYLEIHGSSGRHYRLRIPKAGRALKYHRNSCDLLVVGTSSEIYRFNLERGQFLQPFQTSSNILNTIDVNPHHNLICVGSQDGTVEAWDSRERSKVSTLDVAVHLRDTKVFPSVTTLRFKNELQMGVGTASGHVLMFDIRSKQPMLIKDHLNRLPIKRIEFQSVGNKVFSLDSAMLKIWDANSGKQQLFIESSSNFNDFCTVPNSGLFFFAQEEAKMQTNYVPTLGTAPKWCSFLDQLTEEIEAETVQNVYDDYKFVTRKELSELNLENLEGTDLLKSYMHGFFVDMKLYMKAKASSGGSMRYSKLEVKTKDANPERLKLKQTLPKVNQVASQKNLVVDDRFKNMFEDEDFQIDDQCEDYKRIVKPEEARKNREIKKQIQQSLEEEAENDEDEDEEMMNEESPEREIKPTINKFKLETKSAVSKQTKKSLMKRLQNEESNKFEITNNSGNRQMTFSTSKTNESLSKLRREKKLHYQERKKTIRSANMKFK